MSSNVRDPIRHDNTYDVFKNCKDTGTKTVFGTQTSSIRPPTDHRTTFVDVFDAIDHQYTIYRYLVLDGSVKATFLRHIDNI